MRKTPLVPAQSELRSPLDAWLDIEDLAAVEMSSEDAAFPFEAALRGNGDGWRAATPGPQIIRLLFDKPTAIRRIRLEFVETKLERTQEFRVWCISVAGEKREVVCQQWNFSPGGSTREIEDYRVRLTDVAVLELEIDPGRGNRRAVAGLRSIALA